MRIGSVVAPGPVVKLAITRSSSDSVKASMKPAAIAGAISGSVMRKKVRNGGQPRSIAASSRLRSKSDKPRLHDHRDEAHGQRGVCDRDGPEAAFDVDRHEQQQQRQPGDHLGHDQRRVDHAGEQGTAAKAAEPHQRDRRKRAEHRGGGGGYAARCAASPRRHSIIASSLKSAAYQRVDQPPQTVTRREALNE